MSANWMSQVPRYEQVKRLIRQFIQDRNLKEGTPLPSEREWAQRLQVSQMTVNRALKELAQEGVVARLIGKGTFVLNAQSVPTPRHALTIILPFPNSRDRWEGFQQAVQKYGLNLSPNWMVESSSHFLSPDAAEKLKEALHGRPRSTALFAAGYYLAAEAIQLAQRLGLKVPEDLSVVGFDDPPSASYLLPPLTTLRQPLAVLGYGAVYKLVSLLKEQEPPTSERLPAELIVRASTAPPANLKEVRRDVPSERRSN